MNFDYFYEHLNIEDYEDKNWQKNEDYQLKAFNKTIDAVKDLLKNNRIRVYYDGKHLKFDHVKASDFRGYINYSSNMDSSSGGEHDALTGEIKLNKNLLFDNGKRAFITLCHEITHELGVVISKNIDKYPKDSKEHQYLSMLKAEIFHEIKTLKAFGIELDTSVYFDPSNINNNKDWKSIKELALAFYALQISERSAFAIEDSINGYITPIIKDLDSMGAYAESVIKDRYDMQMLSYDEICKAFDRAKTNLILGRSPAKGDNLEAAITYDLAVFYKIELLEYKRSSGEKCLVDETDCWRLLNAYDRNYLLNYYYKDEGKFFNSLENTVKINGVVIVNDLPCGEFVDFDIFKAMSDDQKESNPRTIALAIYWNKEKVIPHVRQKAFNIFENWYFSRLNDLSEDVMNDIADVFKGEHNLISLPSGRKVNKYSYIGQQLQLPSYDSNLLRENPSLQRIQQDLKGKFHDQTGYKIERKEDFSDLLKKFFPKPKEKKNQSRDINR